MAVSQDGARAATGGADGVIRIWNLQTNAFENAMIAHRYYIYRLVWSPDGRLRASHAWGGADGKVIFWDFVEGKQLHALTSHRAAVTQLAWSPSGKQIASSDAKGMLIVWDAASGQQEKSFGGTVVTCPPVRRQFLS